MSQWSQYWNTFREEPGGGTLEDDFDFLQAAMPEEQQSPMDTLYEVPSFGEDTSFSDATLMSGNLYCAYGATEPVHTVHNTAAGPNPEHIQPQQGVEDSFMTLPNLNESESDWFNSIFEEQGLVYNDKNLGEAATQPCIKAEHSYSAANSLRPSSPLALPKIDDSDTALFNHHSNALDLTQKNALIQAAATATQPLTEVKAECLSHHSDPLLAAMTSGDTTSAPLTRPATIILATTTSSTSQQAYSHGSQSVFPTTTTTVHIKSEPMESYDSTLQEQTVNVETLMMPPTPPSSAGSDSDGSASPQRSAPNSPQRQSPPVRVYQYHHLQHHHHHHHASSHPLATSTCAAQTPGGQQSLFLSPMPTSGVLILSEEEKRTLISEGYPVPAKLPLTKQEEKNLKKVRRKIKNKISAQESRRKKKEYLEALEKRVETFNHENCDLKKKVESLETNNRTLLGQLSKLQAAIAKVPRSAAASATQTGTVLMVLVLCFAVFLGGSGGGPSSLNVGYTAVGPARLAFQQPGPLRAQPNMGPGPARADDTADDYATPNLKSRVLMALGREEPEDWCDDYRPLVPWERDQSCAPPTLHQGLAAPGVQDVMPVVSESPEEVQTGRHSNAVVTVAVGADSNATESVEEFQATMHPDIAVAPTMGRFGNFSTADLGSA